MRIVWIFQKYLSWFKYPIYGAILNRDKIEYKVKKFRLSLKCKTSCVVSEEFLSALCLKPTEELAMLLREKLVLVVLKEMRGRNQATYVLVLTIAWDWWVNRIAAMRVLQKTLEGLDHGGSLNANNHHWTVSRRRENLNTKFREQMKAIW